MIENQLLIHIGYPKAGSSSLQAVFNSHSSFNIVAARITRDDAQMNFLERVGVDDSLQLSNCELKSLYSTLLNNHSSKTNAPLVNVISEESFSGSSTSYADRGLVATRLSMLSDNAKVVIVIREQLSIIRSRYLHNPSCIYALSPAHSKDPMNIQQWIDKSASNYQRSYLSTYDYYQISSLYCDIFGASNVCILLFEELVSNPCSFWNKLLTFCGIEFDPLSFPDSMLTTHKNAAKSLNFHRVSRFLHKLNISAPVPVKSSSFYVSLKNFISFSGNNNLDFTLPSLIKAEYINSNRKLNDRFHLQLEKFGYLL